MATLSDLIGIRSQLAAAVLAYVEELAREMAKLPPYFPSHLQPPKPSHPEAGPQRVPDTALSRMPFDAIRQTVRVVADRALLERWRKELEEAHRDGRDVERMASLPYRSWLEGQMRGMSHELLDAGGSGQLVPWDEQAGETFPRAMILGDPGYGKTWLLRYEARRLARVAAEGLRHQTLRLDDVILPIYSRCSDLNDQDDPLEEALLRRVKGSRPELFIEFVRERLKSKQCVLLLDAWDEVAEERPPTGHGVQYLPRHRQRLGQRVEAFARAFPLPRILVACRIVEYHAAPVPDASELVLVDFQRDQVQAFVEVWFPQPARRGRVMAMLDATPRVMGLARIPLMLTLMCRLWQKTLETAERAHRGASPAAVSFPTRRAEIYERCLRGLLVEREGERQGRRIDDAEVEPVLELLQEVAFELFRERYEQFSGSLLYQKIVGFQRRNPNHPLARNHPGDLVADLRHWGILITTVEREDPLYLLLHRTFHEYLVARHLCAFHFPSELVRLLREDHQMWWEVGLLAGSRLMSQNEGAHWQLLEALCPLVCEGRARDNASDADYRMAWLAGQIALENELNEERGVRSAESGTPNPKLQTRNAELIDRIRWWLGALVDDGRLPVRERARAGVVLGNVGDPRPGVGLRKDGLPDLVFVPAPPQEPLPAGRFELGETREQVTIEHPCRIGLYPVTVKQYAAFVEMGGYGERGGPRPAWWTEEGWAWRNEDEKHGAPKDYRPEFQTPNHPRVGVCHHEATAFSAWMTVRLREKGELKSGEVIRLPHEAEWEQAARWNQRQGKADGRTYPWGEADRGELAERCNCLMSGIHSTSTVGMFPAGVAESGALDLSGNVWEWCEEWCENWYDDQRKTARVLRGGSWVDGFPDGLSSSFRYGSHPGNHVDSGGFRCVVGDSFR
jgi:formylglycine-generating enzyme required for sulfatase activity